MEQNEAATLSITEVASKLGIGKSLAYEAANDGRIPVIRIGRRILVTKAALERLLESGMAS